MNMWSDSALRFCFESEEEEKVADISEDFYNKLAVVLPRIGDTYGESGVVARDAFVKDIHLAYQAIEQKIAVNVTDWLTTGEYSVDGSEVVTGD